jgi:hypothetical protein
MAFVSDHAPLVITRDDNERRARRPTMANKISDIRGEAVIDLLADIIDPIANIASDPKMTALFKVEVVDEDADKRTLALDRIRRHVPTILKSHKADVIAILAAINSKAPEEYAEGLTIMSLTRDLLSVINDPELVGFFTSAAASATEGATSGSTSTITGSPLALA